MSWYTTMHNPEPDDGPRIFWQGMDYDDDIFAYLEKKNRDELVALYESCGKDGIQKLDKHAGDSSVHEIQLALQVFHSDFETGLCPGTK